MRPTSIVMAALLTASGAAAADPPALEREARAIHVREAGGAFQAIRGELGRPVVDKPKVQAAAASLLAGVAQVDALGPAVVALRKRGPGPDPKGWAEQVESFGARARRFDAVARNGDVAEMKIAAPSLEAACQSCHARFRLRSDAPFPRS